MKNSYTVQGRINRYIEDVSKSDGETLGLLASRPNEFSREGPQFGGGHGVFTYYLLKGMMGEADTDGDETVNVTELVDYLDQNVEEATDRQQHVREFGTFEAETPITFIDKPGPEELQLGQLPRPRGTEIASLQVTPPEGAEVRTALQQALREGRLLAPAEDNAWDLYRQFAQLSVPESEKEDLQDDLFIALATAGDRVLSAYRRGDQVIRLDAAKYNEGAQLYGRALELDPEDFTLPPKAKFMAGRALVEGGRYSEGISLLRAAIKLDPEAAHSYNALGIAHMKLGQWNDALANFRAASERAEKWVYPHYNTALVHIARQRYRDAEQEFHKGIELGTELGLKYSYLHYNLGILYLNQGRYKDAEEQFRRAVGMMPDDALSYYNLGLLFEQRGDMRQAEAQFRKGSPSTCSPVHRGRWASPTSASIATASFAGRNYRARARVHQNRLPPEWPPEFWAWNAESSTSRTAQSTLVTMQCRSILPASCGSTTGGRAVPSRQYPWLTCWPPRDRARRRN